MKVKRTLIYMSLKERAYRRVQKGAGGCRRVQKGAGGWQKVREWNDVEVSYMNVVDKQLAPNISIHKFVKFIDAFR